MKLILLAHIQLKAAHCYLFSIVDFPILTYDVIVSKKSLPVHVAYIKKLYLGVFWFVIGQSDV